MERLFFPHRWSWYPYQKSVHHKRVGLFLYSQFYSAAAAAAKSLQLCPTLCDPRDGRPSGSPRPWDSPGKNTGMDCYFLLQCMKVKSESEVTQLCQTPSEPMDCSLTGSSIHGICQARVLCIYICFYMPVPHYLNHCCLAADFELRNVRSPTVFFV